MAEDDGKTEAAPQKIWFDSGRSRFFLIPEDAEVVEGTYVISSLPAQRKHVDEAAISAYEVDATVATEHIDAQVRGNLSRAAKALKKAFGANQDQEPDIDPEKLFGISAGEMLIDPEAAREGLKHLIEQVGDAAGKVKVPEDASADARARWEEITQKLAEGPKLQDRLDRVEGAVGEALPKLGAALGKLATSLEAAADRLQHPPEDDAPEDAD